MDDATAALVNLYTTVGDEPTAKGLVRDLLERGLVACGNLWPIQSLYVWEGEVQDDGEVAVLLKTTADRVADLMEALREVHPYEVPCMEVFPVIGCHRPFGAWVADAVRPR